MSARGRGAGPACGAASRTAPAPRPPRMTLGGALRSELVRLRRSPLLALHAALAVALGVGAGLYFGLGRSWDPMMGTDAFFQLLGAGAPLLAGLSCGLSAESEREAGELSALLGVPRRRVALAAKALVLLGLGALAALLSAGCFCATLAACGSACPDAPTVLLACAAMAAGSLLAYVLCLAVALRWGRNACVAVGALGLAVVLGSLGGLANGLVTGTLSGTFAVAATAWVPFGWPARLASLVVECAVVGPGSAALGGLHGALGLVGAWCAALTAAGCAAALALCGRLEDRLRGE